MRVAVIGAGFTGLTAAYRLALAGHHVAVFEKEKFVGGLAGGFKEVHWSWPLEQTYHHFFANDTQAFALFRELGIADKLLTRRPITANYLDGKIYPFDSPVNLLGFTPLSVGARLRTGVVAAFCKIDPFWRPLESLTAQRFVRTLAGLEGWQRLWEPLLYGKFGELAPTVSASWFWARIHKRTPRLVYPSGGYTSLSNSLQKALQRLDVRVFLDTSVSRIDPPHNQHDDYQVHYTSGAEGFDRVLLTIPTVLALRLLPGLPVSYTKPLGSIPHLHAQTLIVETKEPILEAVYWLNILDRSFPFLAAVAHTNFMDKRHYAGHHVTYFANYLPPGHPYLSMNQTEILKLFTPYIKKLQPSRQTKLSLVHSYLFTGLFAQPVHGLHYSQKAPRLTTPLAGITLANMDSIVPWDRGVNYAIDLGEKAAKNIG